MRKKEIGLLASVIAIVLIALFAVFLFHYISTGDTSRLVVFAVIVAVIMYSLLIGALLLYGVRRVDDELKQKIRGQGTVIGFNLSIILFACYGVFREFGVQLPVIREMYVMFIMLFAMGIGWLTVRLRYR